MTVLLPMVKLELSSKNLNFGKLASVTMHMTTSQYLEDFSDETNFLGSKVIFLVCVKWNVSIFGIFV